MSKHLTYSDRVRLETMLKDGLTQREAAVRLGKHYNTINREVARGMTQLLNGSTWEFYDFYSADIAQAFHNRMAETKGRPLKIGKDYEYASYLERKIKEDKYSPYAAIESAKSKFNTTICTATLYSYIDKGVFFDLNNADLPRRKDARIKPQKPRRGSQKNPHAKSIDERPKAANKRDSLGHWELDTVVGGQKKGKDCLMVLTERSSRVEIIEKLVGKTQEDVVKAFDRLEKRYGAERFKTVFKTITADNGTEFLDCDGIEKSCFSEDTRTRLFFCHAQCPGVRGSNENQNRLIRRFCPKGCDFSQYTEMDIKNVENWLNAYPRRIFGGMSAGDVYAAMERQCGAAQD